MWAVGVSGDIFKLDGVTAENPMGTGWTNVKAGVFEHVSIGD